MEIHNPPLETSIDYERPSRIVEADDDLEHVIDALEGVDWHAVDGVSALTAATFADQCRESMGRSQ